MQASKNYELFCKRKINLHCHTLIFFMFIGSFTQTCLGLLEALRGFLIIALFFRTYPPTRQRIIKISISWIFSSCNLAISKSHCLENCAISNFFPVFSEFKIVALDCNKNYPYVLKLFHVIRQIFFYCKIMTSFFVLFAIIERLICFTPAGLGFEM